MTEQIRNRIAEINQRKVPEGYKKTPLGVIPEEWEDKTLSDIGDFYKGKGIPGNELQDDGVPCIGYGDIYMKYNYHFEKAVNFVDQKTANESQPIQKGTLLFTGSGETAEEIGKCVCYNGDEIIYAGGDIILYNSDVNPLFIAYQQSIGPSVKTKAKLAQGHSVVHIYADRLGKLPVAYPKNKHEQQKIAEILMKWDEAIALQEKLIEKLEVQKKALMQEVFKSHSSWEEVNFSDIYSMAGEGGTPSTSNAKYYIDGDIPFVKIEHLSEKYIYKIGSFITDLGMKNSGAWLIPVNSLLYSNGATIGEISINRIPVTTKQGILGIVPKEKVLTEFLYYLMQSSDFKNKIKAITTKGTMPIAYLKDINNLKIKLPDIKQQTAISEFLSKIDQSIKLRSKKVSALKLQQKSLMQLLLTGIVRV